MIVAWVDRERQRSVERPHASRIGLNAWVVGRLDVDRLDCGPLGLWNSRLQTEPRIANIAVCSNSACWSAPAFEV